MPRTDVDSEARGEAAAPIVRSRSAYDDPGASPRREGWASPEARQDRGRALLLRWAGLHGVGSMARPVRPGHFRLHTTYFTLTRAADRPQEMVTPERVPPPVERPAPDPRPIDPVPTSVRSKPPADRHRAETSDHWILRPGLIAELMGRGYGSGDGLGERALGTRVRGRKACHLGRSVRPAPPGSQLHLSGRSAVRRGPGCQRSVLRFEHLDN